MPRPATFPQLHDPAWLRVRHAAGLPQRAIAAEIGCSAGAVGRALKRYGLVEPDVARHGELMPRREFAGLATRLETNALADLDADVDESELHRRLSEGLTDLAALAELAERTSRDALWDLVVSQVDPATARAVAFAAGVLAARQSRRDKALA